MCNDHSGVLVEIPTASKRGPDGNKRAIDACLAPLVKVLNDNGIGTKACCCGHGKRPGTIILTDGRELHILPDFETGRRLDRLIDEGALAMPTPMPDPGIFDPFGKSCEDRLRAIAERDDWLGETAKEALEHLARMENELCPTKR